MTDFQIFIKALIVSVLSTVIMMLFTVSIRLNVDDGAWFIYQQVTFWGISIESQIKKNRKL